MPFRIITIPFDSSSQVFMEEGLNNFCVNKKLASYKAEFFTSNGSSYWTVFIEYDPLLEPAGEVSDLKEADMVLYNKLRQWRREQAEAQGVPVFIISTNGILKQVAIRKPETVEELKNIRGIGKAKLEKYGQELIDLVKTFTEKT